MNASSYRVRRATVDDLPELGPLLQATLLSATQLEKRFTEFQVAEGPNGKLAGALGLQIAGKHGKVHSESYVDFGLVDILRPLLWERLQNLAQTHQLVRFWTEETAPFWKQNGFEPASTELRQKLPAAFGETKIAWLTLKLKEDIEEVASLDKEFAMFMEAEKARTHEVFEQAKVFKLLAYLFAIALFLFVLVAGIMLLKKVPR
jgi:N-acetylglutamate synthase-like GNAT family acetyltransferase